MLTTTPIAQGDGRSFWNNAELGSENGYDFPDLEVWTPGWGGMTYRSAWWPRRALVTSWSRGSLVTQVKLELVMTPRPYAPGHHPWPFADSEFSSQVPKGDPGWEFAFLAESPWPVSEGLHLSSASSVTPRRWPSYFCHHLKPHDGRAHVPLTCSPFRPSLCTWGTNQTSAKPVALP